MNILSKMLVSGAVLGICAAAVASATPIRYIRNIEISRGNVYPDTEGFLHRTANRFHVVTREGVIRQRLAKYQAAALELDN